jgi:gliding motility-associated lipoprotein GldD
MNFSCKITFLFSVTIIFFSCESKETQYVPKPKGYNRIDLPVATYIASLPDFPYTFELSKEAIVRPDSSKIAEKYWIHIIYPKFGKAEIQITYKNISANPKILLEQHIDDSYRLMAKHQIKADAIQEKLYTTADGLPAMAFGLSGQVPSHLQFYTTDSTKHFLRAAVYFRTATQNDSLAPVIEFVRQDLMQMIKTLKFKK